MSGSATIRRHPTPMTVGVVGTGHVGLLTCLSLAEVGHTVVGADADHAKVDTLAGGQMPFHEPGAAELLKQLVSDGRLRFVTEISEAVAGADVVFICVGTPPRASGEANLIAVEQAAREIARAATGALTIVEKSTVPAGTAVHLQRTLALERPDLVDVLDVVSCPEFLREGQAIEDSMRPDRILVGAASPRAFETMRGLYRPFIEGGARLIETDITSAELAKHAANAFLALKISFANALARLCEASGGDIEAVTSVMGADPRIGPEFLRAGLGFGGYCFPKDLVAFERLADRLGYPFPLLAEVARLNEEALETAFGKVKDALWNLEGKRIALLGLSFKPGTDDVRFSPALALARRLLTEGAQVVGYDPVATVSAQREVPELEVAGSPLEAARGANCLVVGTDWDEFRDLDLEELGERAAAKVIVDGRNLLDGRAAAAAGFSYRSMGRPDIHPPAGEPDA